MKNLFFDSKVTKITILGLIFCFAFWTSSEVIHDWIDPQLNIGCLALVLKGGTAKYSLSITNPVFVDALFYLTVVFETILSLVLIASFIITLFNYNNLAKFKLGINVAKVGLLLCFVKYFVLFVVIASEWFYMWQTSEGTQMSAGVFCASILAAIIYLELIDQ